nr:hypothetical protein [Salinibacterium sp. PAMC 21357]
MELEEGAAEYAPQIIHSIVTGAERIVHVNVVNRGLISNLPEGAIVEVPATVDSSGITPHVVGAIPTQGAALNRSYLSVAELTIEAALTGNSDRVRQALLADPNAISTLTPEQIWALCDEMTEAHAAVLPVSLGGQTELILP